MKYIIANFKLNGSNEFLINYSKQLKKLIKKPNKIAVCVPNVYVNIARQLLPKQISVGLQNISEYKAGAYTGEVSSVMATDIGADYVIIGHSERRNIFKETNEQIASKLKNTLDCGLTALLCVGEKLEDKTRFKSVIASQLKTALQGISNLDNCIIAYEPIWAIGTGQTATLEDIKKVHKYIKEYTAKNFGKELPVIYGGSVKSSNSAEILTKDYVDGVLVGGASLDVNEFVKIYNSQF